MAVIEFDPSELIEFGDFAESRYTGRYDRACGTLSGSSQSSDQSLGRFRP